MALRDQESCFSTTSPLSPNFKLVRVEARAGVGFQARVGLSLMSLQLRPQWIRKFRAVLGVNLLQEEIQLG